MYGLEYTLGKPNVGGALLSVGNNRSGDASNGNRNSFQLSNG